MSDLRYILFKGSLQPKNRMKATDSNLNKLTKVGYRQGKDYEIVSLKILEDMLGKKNKKGGKIKASAKGGGVRKRKYNG